MNWMKNTEKAAKNSSCILEAATQINWTHLYLLGQQWGEWGGRELENCR